MYSILILLLEVTRLEGECYKGKKLYIAYALWNYFLTIFVYA